MHNLKFQVKFYLGTLLRIVAKVAPRNCSKEVREEPGYMSFCWEKNPAVEHQRLLLITHTHTHTHLELMILVLFCVWEDARIWAL